MGEQTVLRFSISVKETFSTWIALTEINKYGKCGLKPNFFDTYLTTQFGVLKFKNISAMSVIFFFKMVKI